MIIKDNFGKEKKEANVRREDYMNDIKATHGSRTSNTSFPAADEFTLERNNYIDSLGNPKNVIMTGFLAKAFKTYIKAGNKIENAEFSLTLEGDRLVVNNKVFNFKHIVIE